MHRTVLSAILLISLNAIVDHSALLASEPLGIGEVSVSSLFGRLSQPPCGVSLAPVYYGEMFTNTRGGRSTGNATQYQALLDLPVSFDLEEMGTRLPGIFFLRAQNTHGRGLTKDFVGDIQVLSNIDSFDNIMQVSEYWWEFSVLDDDVTVRLGKQDFNSEFVLIDVAEDFIHSSFGLSPSSALPSYPNPSMAALIMMQFTETLQLKVGVWDAFAVGGGFGFSKSDSLLVAGELEFKYALGGGRYPGTISWGAGILTGDEHIPLGDVNGYSFQFEQLVYRESKFDAETLQGLSIFAGLYPRTSDPPVLRDAVGDSYVAGLLYEGLVPGRDADVTGAGIAWAELFLGGTDEETAVELFYKAQITSRMSLQSDLQYISSPSGIYRDALVVGVRFGIEL